MKILFDALKINRDEFKYFCNLIQASKESPTRIEEDKRMSENYIVINGKKTELTEEHLKALRLKQSKRWRAKNGGIYFYVDCWNVVVKTEDCNYIMDNKNYYNHNYFRTKDEAVVYARVLETEMLLKKFADEHNDPPIFNFNLKFAVNFKGDVCVSAYPTHQYRQRTIWFTSRQIAKQAIDEIGEDRIEEYLTYEW